MEKTYSGVIINDNKVLLIRQLSDFYEFPRGIKSENETEVESVIREIKDDSGLNVTVDENKRYEISLENIMNIPKTIVFYIGEVIGASILKDSKNDLNAAEWVNIEDVKDSLTFNSSKNAWDTLRENANI